ncbi:MAG: diaminopimelate decarboxylase [Pseudobacteriovorax sp.]|nr:diaminopimelate decarboxylase [Pseudobacteriovorax sp.]
MDYFNHRDGQGYCEDVALAKIAKEVGTPAYIYSKATLDRHLKRFREAFVDYPSVLCFAVKANSNIGVLNQVFKGGFGADLVSGGELKRAVKAGVEPGKIVFSGVGKTKREIEGALDLGILSFNVESPFELASIASIAKEKGVVAPISLRVNPNIDAKTNPKIATGLFSTKFGIVESEVLELAKEIKDLSHVSLVGIACHIGSQITSLQPIQEAAEKMAELAIHLKELGHDLKYLNMGGGLGIRYQDETAPEIEDYAKTLIDTVKPTGLTLVIEPGRVLLGNVGILLTEVIGVKKTPQKTFVIVDGAMNDVLRPSLYDSYHEIVSVNLTSGDHLEKVDVVGPICETGDFFGKDRDLPLMKAGDLLYLRACGAYSSSMASNYNSRPRAPEVLVDGDKYHVVAKREELSDLWERESIVEDLS